LSAADLIVAGFAPDELRAAGFNAGDIKAANLRLNANEGMTQEQQKLLGRLTDEQLSNMTTADLENFMRQQQAMMKQQANTLFTSWAQIPLQQYVQGEEPKSAQELTAAAKSEKAAAAALKDVDIYKAGMVIFAVLDAEVNSDENAPAMATIIQGPLKGSKVLGNFSRVDKKVLLQFSVLSVPKLANSISVSAVAVDPNTAKTALASSVNNHYMLRYGTLFATSFVSGLASAVQNAGSLSTTTTTGSTTSMPPLNMMQKLLVGLGAVGQQLSTAASSNINMPPTIKVKAGTSIGLLLMSDLSVPKN
jgi:intracellular multiplication protein IcmE